LRPALCLRLAALVALLTGACSYHPVPGSGQQECAPAGSKRCPDGYHCLSSDNRDLCWKNGEGPTAAEVPDSGDQLPDGSPPDLGLAPPIDSAVDVPEGSDVPDAADAPSLVDAADAAPPDVSTAGVEVGLPADVRPPDVTPDIMPDTGPPKPICTGGYEDCDGKPDNGCEVNLQGDPKNCGKCAMVCPLGAGGLAAVCTNGVCGMATCSAPLMNCDGVASNGCESDTSSDVQNCGTCRSGCTNPAQGTAGCGQGKCRVASCMGAFRDCNGQFSDGCEVNTASDLQNCGMCNNPCPARPNSTAVCKPSGCDLVCTAPFDNCDGDKVNGCETDLRTSTRHCGDCSTPCDDPPHGAAWCGNSTCKVNCTGSFRDCDGQFLNGCEVDTSTSTQNCSGCNLPCTAPNATVTAVACSASTCKVTACNAPQADCDHLFGNGCEVNTSTDPNHCGSCGNVCGPGFACQGTCVWTPKALSGLVLWLDAAQLVTVTSGRVSAWGDLSGQNNNAGQGVISSRPTVETNAFGSHPGIAFNPLNSDNQFLSIPDATSLQFGTGDFTLVVVAKAIKNDQDISVIFSKQEQFAPYPGPSLWLNLPNEPASDPVHDGKLMFQAAFNGTGEVATTAHGFDNGVPFILTGRRIAVTTIRVRANGVQIDSTLGNDNLNRDVSAVGHPVILGANGIGDFQQLEGSIGEIIAIKGSVSAADLTALETYLESKYAGLTF
jgi:hypothetical protein